MDGNRLILILTVPAILLFGVAAWAKLEEARAKLVIESDKLVYSTLFGTQEIGLNEVKGYRFYFDNVFKKTGPTVEIHATSGYVIVMHDSINDFAILVDWLGKHFPNLRMALKAEENREMIEDENLGEDTIERLKFIELARMVSYVINGLGLGAAVMLFVADLSVFTVAAAILVFPLSVGVVLYFKGIIYYNNKTDSAHPHVALGLLVISLGLFGKGIFVSAQLVSYSSVPWLIITLIALGMIIVLVGSTKEFSRWTSMDMANVGAFLFVFWLMGFGSYVMTNMVLDKSLPRAEQTTVVGKSNGDKTTSLEFVPAGGITDKHIDVDEELYDRIAKGDTITLQIFSGAWGSPWYRVKE
jgi:hypothetical protein